MAAKVKANKKNEIAPERIRALAAEIDKIMFPGEEIDHESMTDVQLTAQVVQDMASIEEADPFSNESKATLTELGCTIKFKFFSPEGGDELDDMTIDELKVKAKKNKIHIPPPFLADVCKLCVYIRGKLSELDKGARVGSAPEKPKTLSKKKKGKTPRYIRGTAVVSAIKKMSKKGFTFKELQAESNSIGIENGLRDNPTASGVNKSIVEALVAFDVLSFNDKTKTYKAV